MVISVQYLWVEMLMGALGAFFCWLTLLELNDPTAWFWALMVTSWLMVLGLIDLNHRLLPDGVTLPPLVIATLFSIPSMFKFEWNSFWLANVVYWLVFPYLFYHSLRGLVGVFFGEKTELAMHIFYEKVKLLKWLGYVGVLLTIAIMMFNSQQQPVEKIGSSFVGLGLALFLLYTTRLIASKLAGQEALGLGDVKMAMVLGWWFGPYNLMLILGLACVFGMAAALVQKFRQRNMAQPFGSMMALSAFLIGVCAQLLMPLMEDF
jgi:prepilin signal peptidase PulO-like enzyme (type II secretory pathway)